MQVHNMRAKQIKHVFNMSVFKFCLGNIYLRKALGDEEQRQIEDEEDASTTNAPGSQGHQFTGH